VNRFRKVIGLGGKLTLSGYAILIFVCLYAPLVLVVANAFNKNTLLTGWGGFTNQWVVGALDSGRVRHDFLTSVVIGLASTGLALAVAIPAALWARRVSPRARRILDGTTYMRIVLPEVVSALALFIFFRRLNFPLGTVAIVIGHVVFNSAYATVIIQARLATLTGVFEDAARDLGARPWRVFFRVTFPFLLPAVIVAGLVAFAFSFDDVITSSFLAGTSVETLPMYIFGLARFNIGPEVNAIGAGLMFITLLSLVLALGVAGGRAGLNVAFGSRQRAGNG
jgi:ABC-type spermidine/putrescine transport system permease subunit II